MPLVDVLKNSFASGECSPLVRALTDVTRYKHAAAQLENWQVLPTGGITRRPGTRYVASAGDSTHKVGLLTFKVSTTDAVVIEAGHLYFRFYKNNARIENPPGTPVQVTTLYTETEVPDLRTAQANDVMILVHPSHPPRRLSRVSDTSWVLTTIGFGPMPLWEAGETPAAALTLSATSGSITIVAGASVFFKSDVNRVLVSGAGRALVTSVTDGTHAAALVLDTFAATAVASGTWTLQGSPWADVTPDGVGPVGSGVTLSFGITQAVETELVDQNWANWTDYSAAVLLITGQHTGLANSVDLLEDVNQDFIAAGVLPTHLVWNDTDGSRGVISSVSPHACGIAGLLFGGTDNDFDNTDAYSIKETGASRVASGVLELHGGPAGHGWREDAVTTVAAVEYEVRFTVTMAPVSLQVGSATTTADLLSERSYAPGEHTARFVATGVTSYVQFRNNQNTWAGVATCSVKRYTIEIRGSGQIGKYVEVNGGVVQLLSVSGNGNYGIVLKALESDATAPAGAWSLLSVAWSSTLGYPRTCVLYEGRLYFGGTARFPQSIWGSVVNDFFNFTPGALATDAVAFTLVDSGGNIALNHLVWMMPAENMLVGTDSGEYRLIGAGDDPISAAAPPRVRLQSAYGSSNVVPVKVDQAIVFAQRQGSKLREIAFDMTFTTRFQVRDLHILAAHLLATSRLLALAYSPEPQSTLWGVRSDGVMLQGTYDLPEQVNAWARWTTDGVVESVAVIPHPTANAHQVWLSVRRVLNGSTVRCIERIDPEAVMTGPGGLTWAGLTVDCAVRYSGAATDTITGLTHLIGETVHIVGDGQVFPPQLVPGTGTIELASAVNTAFVGLPYTATAQTFPPELPSLGTIQRSHRHWTELGVLLVDTGALSLDGELLPIPAGTLHTGDMYRVNLGWDREGRVQVQAASPLPATVLGVIGRMDLEAERDVA